MKQPMSKPVLAVQTVLTFLTVLFGGMGVGGLGADNATVALIGAWGTLATGAANAAAGYYLAQTNTANNQVAEYVVGDTVFAGEANESETGREVRRLGDASRRWS